MDPTNEPADIRDDKSSGDRSSPASSIHSNSSHSCHSLRIVVSDDHSSSQGSVSRKRMLLNQYQKEQNIKNDNTNESEPDMHQNTNSAKETYFSDNDTSAGGRHAIDPASSSDSDHNGALEEKDNRVAVTPEMSNHTQDRIDLQQDTTDRDDHNPSPSHDNRNTPPPTSNKKGKKPNPLISETKKCQVCSAPAAKHIHYGATTCFSCRAFFRRSIQTSQSRNYVCRRQGNCNILPDTRKGCQKCRLEACLKIGMKPGWVLNEDERARRFRKLRQKKAEKGDVNFPSNADANVELLANVAIAGAEEQNKFQQNRLTPSPTAYDKRRRFDYLPQENAETDNEQSSSVGYKRMYLQLREGQKNLDGGNVSDNAVHCSDALPIQNSGYTHFKKGYKKHEISQQINQDYDTTRSSNANPALIDNVVEERRRFPRLDNNSGHRNTDQGRFRDEIAEKSIAFLRNNPTEFAAITNDPAARIWLSKPRTEEISNSTEENIELQRIGKRSENNFDSSFATNEPVQRSSNTVHSYIEARQRSPPQVYIDNHPKTTTETIVSNEIENMYRSNQNIAATDNASFVSGEYRRIRIDDQRGYPSSSISSHESLDYYEKRRGMIFMDDKGDWSTGSARNQFPDRVDRISTYSKTAEQQKQFHRSSPDRPTISTLQVFQRPLSVAARLEGMLVGPGEDEIRVVNQFAEQHDKYYKSVNFGEDLIKEMIMSSIFGIPMSSNTAMSAYRLMVQRVTRVSKNFNDFTNLSCKVQEALLKHNADLVVSLRGAAFFYMKTGLDQILTSLGFDDLETTKTMILTTLKSNSTKETDYKKIDYKKFNTIQKTAEQSALELKYDSLLSKIGAAVSFNQNLVKILSYILMFCSDFSDEELDLSDRTSIEKAQEKIILIAQRYIFATYPEEMASSVYNNMMDCLGNLRELVFIKSKRGSIQEQKNNMKSSATAVH